MSRPRFKKAVILGVGLLGGSMARALRKQHLSAQVWGWGKSAKRLSAAKRAGLLTHASMDLAEAAEGADLIVLATPFTHFEGLLIQLSQLAPAGCIVTDVGSVKGPWARRWHRAAGKLHFVPGHPMAGSEKTGWEHADARLFKGAAVILTPLPSTSKPALAAVAQLWKDLGAKVHQRSPDAHDRIIGRFSHLTHLVSFALAGHALRGLAPSDLALAGPSFRGATRVAASDAGLWRDIFEYNRKALLAEARGFEAEFKRLRALRGNALYARLHAISSATQKSRR